MPSKIEKKKAMGRKRRIKKPVKPLGGPVFTPDVYGQIENVLTKTLRGTKTSKRKTGGKLTEKQKKIDMNNDGVINDKDFKIINADRTGGSTMTKKKHGGGVCARATGQGLVRQGNANAFV